MKIKTLLLTFALALTVWAQTETKTPTPVPEKKGAVAAEKMSCCKDGCCDSKDGKMKCDMAAHKEGKGCCGGMKEMADMKGMDHMQHMADMKDAKGEHTGMSCGAGMKGKDGKAMSCCGGMKDKDAKEMACCGGKDGKMKCDMSAHKEAMNGKGCCGDKCPMHGEHMDHGTHPGN